jgi:predicted metal-dependent hydrolase
VSKTEIDKFVQSKTKWIEKQLAKPPVPKRELKHFDDDICLEKFNKIADDVYPLIAKKIKFKPILRIKDYKSRWGVCFTKRGYIILNKQLFDKPIPAIEYVILHEYVHFLVPNHGSKFHKIMGKLMPDYKERRKLLKNSGK